MANEITIPILPCASMKETLEFYVALGFEITYQQAKPNTYACVKREDIELHFFTMKGYEPKDSDSTCFVLVPDLAGLHLAFSNGLRSHYGKLPVAGIPRITKPNNNNSTGDLRFNVIDPGGNWIRFGQRIETQETEEQPAPQKAASTKLSRAIRAADLLADSKGDYAAAAKMLDTALADGEPAPSVQRVQALVLRAGLAITMGEPQHARSILTEVRQIPLHDEERSALTAELQTVDDLEDMLQ